MVGKKMKSIMLFACSILCLCVGTAFAAQQSGTGVAAVATNVIGNLGAIAKLITAGAYVAGFGFAVAAIVKFKAHKDNPTQIHISQPIVYLFVAAALLFTPTVFKTSGATLFGKSGTQGSVSGASTFSNQT